MCERAVEKYPGTLEFVPDWFVTQQQLKIWGDDDDYFHNNELIKWYEGYQKRRAQRAKIKEELILLLGICHIGGIEKKIWTFLYLMTGYKNFLTKKNYK